MASCFWCKGTPAEILLAGQHFCPGCAHKAIDEAVAYHRELELKVQRDIERNRRNAPRIVDGVKDGVPGVYFGERFLRGWTASMFRRTADVPPT